MRDFPECFLAATTAAGFVSHFAGVYRTQADWRVFLIKGGPGTGKSWLLRQIAAAAGKDVRRVIACPCSSDPESLDAVILPDERIFVCDSTAPHTVEPVLPGACENLIDLGAFWHEKGLYESRAEIAFLASENSRLHQSAARLTAAAGSFFANRFAIADGSVDVGRVRQFAADFCKRLPRRDTLGQKIPCFLQGITPQGLLSFPETATEYFEHIFVLADDFGAVTDRLYAEIANHAVQKGHTVWVAHNPLLPKHIDHLLLPQAGLALVRQSRDFSPETAVRRCHARRFCRVADLHTERSRLQLDAALGRAFLQRAVRELQSAKAVHDRLEAVYRRQMDFAALTAAAGEITARILV